MNITATAALNIVNAACECRRFAQTVLKIFSKKDNEGRWSICAVFKSYNMQISIEKKPAVYLICIIPVEIENICQAASRV